MSRQLSSEIHLSPRPGDWEDWRWQFRNRFKGLHGLKKLIPIPRNQEGDYKDLLALYHFAATPYYVSLIDFSDPGDPIRRQIVPDLRELFHRKGGSVEDPFLEQHFSPVPGLIHRFEDRVLLMSTTLCGVYCRHCNRKRNWSKKGVPNLSMGHVREAAFRYIESHPEVREVILSGGDPLYLRDSILEEVLRRLRSIPHVEVIRIGTRAPVTLPMRIDDDLCSMLRRYRPIWVNTQFNHPREITAQSKLAVDRLVTSGIPVCNQAVLLKGINDDIKILKELFQRLQAICVKPYYLFHCDPVMGTDHFRTTLSKGMAIMEGLWGKIGGLCIPHYVVDLPNAGGKAPLMPTYLLSMDGGEAIFRTIDGDIVKYPFRDRGSLGSGIWT